VPIGRSQIFVATNTGGASVTWSVPEAGGGTVDASGNYTAPMSSGTFHVVATAGGKTASATVTVADFQLSLLAGKLGGNEYLDGTGNDARLVLPTNIVGDGTGQFFFTDTGVDVVREYDTATNQVTTIAGSGSNGYLDGVGVLAEFDSPSGIAFDRTNHVLYVSEQYKDTIRQIDLATGMVTTIAGQPGSSGSTNGAWTAARFNNPTGLRFDSTAGALYVADTNNNLIRRMDVATNQVVTVAGNGTSIASDNGTGTNAGIVEPNAMVLYNGILYIACYDHTIRSMGVGGTHVVQTLAGTSGSSGYTDAYGAAARFNEPAGLLSDGAGSLYVADSANNLIRQIEIGTGQVTTFAGQASAGANDGTGTAAQFSQPTGIGFYNGSMYVTDNSNGTLRAVTVPGAVTSTVAGLASGGGAATGPFSATRLQRPVGLGYDGHGDLFVTDSWGDDVRTLVLTSQTSTRLAGQPGQAGAMDGDQSTALFNGPAGIALDSTGGELYVTDTGSNVVREVTVATLPTVTTPYGDITTGMRGFVDATGTQARFSYPTRVVEVGGALFVADSGNNAIRRIDLSSGAVSTFAGSTTGAAGNADGVGTAATFSLPAGLAWDGGNFLYVADAANGRIRQIDLTTAEVSTIAGSGVAGAVDGIGAAASFAFVIDLAYDGAGTLYASDPGAGTIRRIYLPTRAVSTLAGIPDEVQAGTILGSVTTARIATPYGLVVTAPGKLLIASSSENAILQLAQQ
jgi:sugar lactone lactonase YvrE